MTTSAWATAQRSTTCERVAHAWASPGARTGVADIALDDAAGLVHGVHAELEVVHVGEAVKDTEDVDAGFDGLRGEGAHDVVGVRRVGDGVGAAEQHLEGHVRHACAQRLEALPGALVQKPHRDVERGAPPHLEGTRVGYHLRNTAVLVLSSVADGGPSRARALYSESSMQCEHRQEHCPALRYWHLHANPQKQSGRNPQPNT